MGFDLGNLIGSVIDSGLDFFTASKQQKLADKTQLQNIAAQYDFAQHGIQWKVQDAINAGINPLAALGASTSSFSNVVGDSGQAPRSNLAGGLKGAFDKEDSEERELDLESKRLRNDYLRAQVHKLQAAGNAIRVAPSQLMDGQNEGEHLSQFGNSGPVFEGRVKVKPFELTPGAVVDPGYMPGKNPGVEFVRDPGGEQAKVIGDKAMRSNDIIGPLQWHARHTVLPALNSLRDYIENVPRQRGWMQLPQREGYQILFNPFTGREYYQKLWSGRWGRR